MEEAGSQPAAAQVAEERRVAEDNEDDEVCLARRREEEEQKEQGEGEAVSSKAEPKLDELERRLEQEESGGAKVNGEAQPQNGQASSWGEGDLAELQIYVGKWVPCKVLAAGSKPDTWCVHILPTTLFDNAAGRSDQDVPDVPLSHLRKAASSTDTAAETSRPTDAAAEASQPTDAAATTAEGDIAAPEAAAAAAAEAVLASGEDKEDKAPQELIAAGPTYNVDDLVVIKGLADKPQMNGVTGTLVEKKWKGNWIVDLNDEEGKKRRLRRRWLINENNFEASDVPKVEKYSAEMGRPKLQYFIVGSWNDFVPRRMIWDHDRCCWNFEVKIADAGFESFQIWLERDKKKSVHPDTANAGNYVPWELRGPDAEGEGKNWSFGHDKSGTTRYEVRLFLWQDESPQAVEWSNMEAKKDELGTKPDPAKEVRQNKQCLRKHDLKIFKPPVDGYSCSQCKTAFPKGSAFMSCRPCDYDLCANCACSSQAPPASSSTSVAKEPAAEKAAEKAAAPGAAAQALAVGDKITIKSVGPFKGKTGTVMKVDEDGDPAVRLESGEAKLFYRADVEKVAAAKANGSSQGGGGGGGGGAQGGYPSSNKGIGKGAFGGKGVMGKGTGSLGGMGNRQPGVGGFR